MIKSIDAPRNLTIPYLNNLSHKPYKDTEINKIYAFSTKFDKQNLFLSLIRLFPPSIAAILYSYQPCTMNFNS